MRKNRDAVPLAEQMIFAAKFHGSILVHGEGDSRKFTRQDGSLWRPSCNDDDAKELCLMVMENIELDIDSRTISNYLIIDGPTIRKGIIWSAYLIGRDME